ncbi:MAG TPA: cyanophycin synthetase, partial [Chitinophagales bacterium]|nr:cyanophycin synthetase [Chitinophagales bacterium]
DDLVYKMREGLECNVALFSLDENNPRIQHHCKRGGLAAVAENGYVTIMKGTWKIRVDRIANIPLTFGGWATFNVQNILASVLACFVQGFKIEDIKMALETFIPSPAQTPGRMNIFRFKNFTVLVDYAHNAHGLQAISSFIAHVDATPKVGVIAGVGDRRDEDIRDIGRIAAKTFDEVVIRQDKNLRGRSDQEIIELLIEGMKEIKANIKYTVIPNEKEAIEFVIKNAKKDSFITICLDVVPDVLETIMRYKEQEDAMPVSTNFA